MQRDTIFALSSGQAPSAIAIVRVSGPRAFEIADALTERHLPEPRHAGLRKLVDPKTGSALDDALLLLFPGPASATGEDVVEFHLHGGRATIAAMLDVIAAQPGTRGAEPGEFTRRALENGLIDLSAAEGLADLLAAETEYQRRSALRMASGGLARRVEQWQAGLLHLSARAEAAIDFSDEDDVEPWPLAERAAALDALGSDIASVLASPPAERLRDGVRIGIAGPPNAGKSTLLNALAGRDAAITSEIAGTTRDVIEVPLILGGVPMILIDMAGLRSVPGDVIEREGIARAVGVIDQVDILLWLGAPGEAPSHERIINLSAQCDRWPVDPAADVAISALKGIGLDALMERLVCATRNLLPSPDALSLNRRQRAIASAAANELVAAQHEPDLLVVAERLRIVRLRFDELTGRAGTEAMLDALFGQFCIGK